MTMQSEINALTTEYTRKLVGIVQHAVLASVGMDTKPHAEAIAQAKRKPAKRTVREIVAKISKARKPKRAPGEKRTPEQIEAAKAQILAYIKDHPGEGIESIGKALKQSTSELSLPLKKLIAEKAVSTKGKKRAMKYTAKGG